MSIAEDRPRLAPNVHTLLAGLRATIRRYVWAEGLAVTAAAACALFWLLLAVDWMFEPPVFARRLLAGLGFLAVAVVFYRLVLRRVGVPITDSNLALLLERRFRLLDDSLLTSVNLTHGDQPLGELGREMLDHTCRQAAQRTQGVRPAEVFNRTPLVRACVAAIGLLLSVGLFALASPNTFRFGIERLSGATDELWPRNTRLVVPGFGEEGERVIAKGDDFDLLVQADTSMPNVPDVVQIRYQTDEGIRGRETMRREGNATPGEDAFQNYRYQFTSLLSSVTFDVLGGDDRVRNLRLRVVENPTVSETVLVCEYPEYMHRSPRELAVTGTMQLPLGTKITVWATANKDLIRAQIDYPLEQDKFHTEIVTLPGAEGDLRHFSFSLPNFDADKTLSFTLFDTDGIHNRKPFVVSLSAVSDEAPQLSVALHGIGSAVTPQARLPLVGKINDDYGVATAAFHYTVDGQDPQLQPFAAPPDGRAELEVNEAFEVRDLELKPGQKLLFGAQATDSMHLLEGDEPHTTIGERFQLDVVTPEALRTMLESRELNLRQRFEAVISEMTDTRDSLVQLKVAPPKDAADAPAKEDTAAPATDKPAGAQPAAPAPAAEALSAAAILIERARQNSEKNAQETLGVAEAFDTIREELINNRVDTEELKIRLKDHIADPLRVIGGELLPELDARLKTLEKTLRDPAVAATARRAALEQADAILVAMEAVRDKMLELESFNEAIELLRGIIASEKELQEQTKARQKNKLRDLLEDEK